MTLPEIYRELGCSNRIYDYNGCFKRVDHPSVRRYSRDLSPFETEYIVETPVGRLTAIYAANTSNPGTFPQKWWITCEEDMKVAIWIEERCEWEWDEEHYRKVYEEWGDLGLPTIKY